MNYQIRNGYVYLYTNSTEPQRVQITEHSGKIVKRKKVNTLVGVWHPGIIIGTSDTGHILVVHHHYLYTYPEIHTLTTYADGNEVEIDTQETHYSLDVMLERALYYWDNAPKYNLVSNNCQHFVSVVARNEKVSQTMEKATDWLTFVSALGFIGGVLTKNRTLVNMGAVGLMAGGVIKVASTSRNTPALPYFNPSRLG